MMLQYPVKPSTGKEEALVAAHRHWVSVLHVSDIQNEPWIPVGTLGGLLVMGHHRRTDNPWPAAVAQGVQLTEEDYVSLWRQWRSHFEGGGLNGASPTVSLHSPETLPKAIEWFFAHCRPLMSGDTLLLLEELRHKGDPSIDELPKGWREHAMRLLHSEMVVDIGRVDIPMEIIDMVPQQMRYKLRIVPYSYEIESGKLWCAAETRRIATEDQIFSVVRNKGVKEVITVCAPGGDIDLFRSLNSAKNVFQKTSTRTSAQSEVSVANPSKVLRIDPAKFEDFTPERQNVAVEDIVHWILLSAYRNGASDIHFEIASGAGRIRIRIDGALYSFMETVIARMEAIINVAKSVCGMTDTFLDCQDKSFGFFVDNEYVNVRASAIPMRPSLSRQKLVFRLLPKATQLNSLGNLKLSQWELKILRRAMQRPNGLVLVSGPTGSGKTTTLYALLEEVKRPDVSIQTIEDPVEREIEGINQTAVNAHHNVTFASALRASLRQDPDVIMLGEIRDEESAALAIQASLTGHLVLSTVHANSAVENVSRLTNLKVDRHLLADTALLLMAQRLVRKLCPNCRSQLPISSETFQYLRSHCDKDDLDKEPILYGKGGQIKGKPCEHCMGHGYNGRVALLEMVPITDELRLMIADGASAVALRQRADSRGFPTLHKAGLRKVLEGVTSLEEAKVWEEAWPSSILLHNATLQ